jgi:hypothetical protein
MLKTRNPSDLPTRWPSPNREYRLATWDETSQEVREKLADEPQTPFAAELFPSDPDLRNRIETTYYAGTKAGYGSYFRNLPLVPHLDPQAQQLFHLAQRDGAKVFQARDCEALEQACIPIQADQVKLPYPVCVVEFPDTYQRRYTDPLNGESRPLFVIVCQLPTTAAGLVFGNLAADDYRASVAAFGTGPGEEIERFLVESERQEATDAPVIRAAINFLLLATNYHWTTRPHDKGRQDHVEKQLKHARRKGRAGGRTGGQAAAAQEHYDLRARPGHPVLRP